MKPAGPCLRADAYDVVPVAHRSCRRFLSTHHYTQTIPAAAVVRHGLVARDDPLSVLGVAVWLHPRPGVACSVWSGPEGEVLVLSRLALAPSVPTNGASFLLGRSIKLLARDGRYRCLLTYADVRQGHTGAIYRASNWEYLGLTEPERIWVDPTSGRQVTRKLLGKKTTHEQMRAAGYVLDGYWPKHKFRYILPARRVAQRTLFDRLSA